MNVVVCANVKKYSKYILIPREKGEVRGASGLGRERRREIIIVF